MCVYVCMYINALVGNREHKWPIALTEKLSFLYTAAQEISNLVSAEEKDKQGSRNNGLPERTGK